MTRTVCYNNQQTLNSPTLFVDGEHVDVGGGGGRLYVIFAILTPTTSFGDKCYVLLVQYVFKSVQFSL